MAKRTYDMAMSSPDPVQVTEDRELKAILLQCQFSAPVSSKKMTALVKLLKKYQSSGRKKVFQNKACVESFLRHILKHRGHLDIAFLQEEISKLVITQLLQTKCNILCDAVQGQRLDWVCYLLEIGADVNQHCDSHLSPLTQACGGGNKDLVVKLIQHKACVNGSVGSKRTPLMEAAFEGYIDIAQCLLENNADPNFQTLDGETALHSAVCINLTCSRKAAELVHLFLQHNAELRPDKYGNTPMSLVVQHGRADLLDCLLQAEAMSREDRINLIEGCAVYRASWDMATVFECLQRAMKERYKDPSNILHKPDQVLDPDLGYVLESRSPQELSERQHNSTALIMECLAIRKRNPYFGGRTRNQFWFENICDQLLSQGNHKEMYFILSNDLDDLHCALRSVVHYLRCLLIGGQILLFSDVTMYLNACRQHLNNCVKFSWKPTDMYFMANGIMMCLLICIWIVDGGNKEDIEFLTEFTKDISTCLQKDFHPINTYSLLTAAVFYWKRCQGSHDRTLSEDLIVFLIECGVSMDCRDRFGDTPLHILAKSDDTSACSMAKLLVENGAHPDLLDKEGETPAQCAITKDIKALLMSIPLPLKCLAAHAILQNNLSLDRLPTALKRFVAVHSGNSIREE